jgi:hypothetical protein
MRRRPGAVSCALFASTLVSTCGGGGGSIPLSQLGDHVTNVVCASSVRCGELPDDATCRAVTGVHLEQIMADVASGKTIYDGTAAAACLDAIAAVGCNLSDGLEDSPEACRKMLQGTVAVGETCFTDTECASQNCALPAACATGTCCAGSCAPAIEQVAAGGDCSGPQSRCVSTATCKVAAGATAPTCQPRVGLGEPCDGVPACTAGLWCQLPVAGGAGTCVRFPGTGEACDAETLPCDSSKDTCDVETNTCAPVLAVGAACGPGPQCAIYAVCDPGTMTCAVLGRPGDGCEGVGDCLAPLDCVVGACVKPTAEPVCP